MQPNKKDILAHLNFLFSEPAEYKDGLIEIAYTPTDSGAVNKAEYFTPDEIEKAADFAERINAQEGVNVYVGAALRNPDTAPFGRSNAADYYAASAIWCDLDDPGAAETAKEKYSRLPPSLIIVTGRAPNLRAQAWWKLMLHETDAAAHKDNLAHICAALNGDRAVVDPARVMRLGGTIAWPKKEGRVPELTEIKRPDKPTVMVQSGRFKDYFPGVTAPLLTTGAVAGAVGPIMDGKPRNLITGKLKYNDLLERTRTPGQWHVNMRDAVASMVSSKWTDEQIRLACGPYCNNGPMDNDLTALIYTGRNKWAVPDPANDKESIDPVTGEIIEKKSGLFYINAPDITYQSEINDFVQKTLTEGAFSVVYGESNCGKTFFMSDLAFHVVQGKEWNGRRVEKGNVLYVSMEGSYGLKNRIEAYKRENKVTLDGFLMMPCAVDFINPEGNINEFIDVLAEAQKKLGDVKLIVIDTLARAIGGGDENSGQDMGMLVRHADHIRAIAGAHICFVHHSGKDKARGARGHSSLRAAVDTEIEISRTEGANFSSVKFAKQRDMEMADGFNFKLRPVTLGQNRHGEDITSCVVEPYDPSEDAGHVVKNVIRSGKTKVAYDALLECIMDKGIVRHSKDLPAIKTITENDFKEYLQRRGLLSDNAKSAGVQYGRIVGSLIENNLLVVRDGILWSNL